MIKLIQTIRRLLHHNSSKYQKEMFNAELQPIPTKKHLILEHLLTETKL